MSDRLRLPEPLPYDFVDEWIDSRMKFVESTWYDERNDTDMTYVSAYRRSGSGSTSRGSYGRLMFDLHNDSPTYLHEEDEDGYIYIRGQFGMTWTAKELTEEEIDAILDSM